MGIFLTCTVTSHFRLGLLYCMRCLAIAIDTNRSRFFLDGVYFMNYPELRVVIGQFRHGNQKVMLN